MRKFLFQITLLIPLLGLSQSSKVFITNEGNFGTGNGSLSVYDNTTNNVTNNVFATANGGALLGDVVQSMEYFNERGYLCINNSAKIEVVDENANYIATIPAVTPRYIKQVDVNKAYATDWGIDGVQVIDLTSNTVSTTITCGVGPEGLAVSNGFAYICNVGGWGLDSTVTVININTDAVETTLTVGDKPNSAVVDKNGNIWILTGGYTEYDANWNVVFETPGVLAMINAATNTVEASYTFPVGNHPRDLVINGAGDKMYYCDGAWSMSVYEFGILDTSLPTSPIIARSFYGLGYDPVLNEIYGSDAVDFVQQGWVYRYASTGSVIDSFQVGIIPGSFAFQQNTLSINNSNVAEISVYPNPTNGRFFINSSHNIKTILVRNVLGAVIKSISINNLSEVIDLNGFDKGIYIVDIETEYEIISKKLILQ
tara:strand:+ start:1000 stop:2280 length:1281 start_codon:yes stop_codon:yes gene_type:complete